MQLKGLSVRGYKSLRNASLTDLAPISALIGANNTGKSAFLQSLIYLSLFSDPGRVQLLLRGATNDQWFADITSDHSGQPISVELEFYLSTQEMQELTEKAGFTFGEGKFGEEFRALFTIGRRDPLSVQLDAIKWLFRGEELGYVVPNPDVSNLVVIRAQSLLNLPPGQKPDAALGNVEVYGLGNVSGPPPADRPEFVVVQMLSDWLRLIDWLPPERAFDNSTSLQTRPFERTENLPRSVQHLYNNSRRTFDAVEELIAELIPGVTGVQTPIDDQSQTRVRLAIGNIDLALVHAGHGVSSLIATVVELIQAPQRSTLLLEEPETAIHPGAQRALTNLFDRLAEQKSFQIILTTHSPIFARDDDKHATLVVSTGQNGTIARKVSRGDFASIKHELGAQNSDLFMFNMVLLCEEESAARFLPVAFSLCGLDLSASGVHVIALGGVGKGRLVRLREYLTYLDRASIKAFVVLDDDAGVRDGIEQLVKDGLLRAEQYWLWSKNDEPAEFEDQFDPADLVLAANRVAQDAGQDPLLDAEELAGTSRISGRMISKALHKYYWGKYNHGLSKPSLADKLAELCASGEIMNVPTGVRDLATRLITNLAEA